MWRMVDVYEYLSTVCHTRLFNNALGLRTPAFSRNADNIVTANNATKFLGSLCKRLAQLQTYPAQQYKISNRIRQRVLLLLGAPGFFPVKDKVVKLLLRDLLVRMRLFELAAGEHYRQHPILFS